MAVEFSTEEGHDILGAEATRGVRQQLFIEALEGRGVREHHVGGILGLLGDPVVLHAPQQAVHQGIHPAGQGREDARPVSFDETVGHPLGAGGIVDGDEGVVDLAIADVVPVHLPGQPVVAVEADLDGEREPGGDANVQEAELAIDEVEVQTQALAAGRNDARPTLAVGQLEALAGLDGRQDAHQTFADGVAPEHGPNAVLLADGAVQVDVGPSCPLGHVLGVLLDPLGLPADESTEVLEPQALTGNETLHGIRPAQGQVTLEEDAIETGNRTGDPGLMFCGKLIHGVLLLSTAASRTTMVRPERHFCYMGRSQMVWLRP